MDSVEQRAPEGRPERRLDLYRRQAIEQLSSPDDLDQLMRLTRPIGWIALVTVVALFGAALAWGLVGRLAVSVEGAGILLQGGVFELPASGGGLVEEIDVAVGDSVQAGQPVAYITDVRLERRVAAAEARVAALTRDLESSRSDADRESAALREIFDRKRRGLQESIAVLETEAARTRRRLEATPDAQGLATDLDASLERLAARRIELADLELEQSRDLDRLTTPVDTVRRTLEQAQSQAEELRASLVAQSRVLAPRDGRVVEILAGRGDLLEPGEPVLSMDLLHGDLEAFLFMPAEAGRSLEPGMVARLRPEDVDRGDSAYLLGEVSRVADYPATRQAMLRLLANDSIVDSLTRRGPTLQVEVRLARDPSRPERYRWSSQPGSPRELESGTLVRGHVVVDQSRPLSFVVPGLDELLDS